MSDRRPFFQRLPFAIAAAHCLPDRFHRFERGTEAALFCSHAADLLYSLLQTGWRLGTQRRLTLAVARVVERIRLLEQAAAPPLLALLHRLLLAVQTAICSLHLDLAPPAAGDSLIVLNPRRSQSMVLRNSRQWLRLRHQLVRAQGRQIMPPGRRLQYVLGPSLAKHLRMSWISTAAPPAICAVHWKVRACNAALRTSRRTCANTLLPAPPRAHEYPASVCRRKAIRAMVQIKKGLGCMDGVSSGPVCLADDARDVADLSAMHRQD